jgi:DNA-binding transcriptional ArsR family regulator
VIVAMVRLLSVALAGVLTQLRPTRDELSRTRRHYAPSDSACEVLAVLTYNLMVISTDEAERADVLFHALADPTRRDILSVVLRDAHSVSDLARRYPISFAAVHKHVGALERAGLVTKTRQGREKRVRGDVATLRTAHRLLVDLEALWRERIHRIEQVLADPTECAPQ